MNRLQFLIAGMAGIYCTGSLLAAEEYRVPRTEWDQADLQGVWNYSTDIPLQRPARFGNQEFLTREEIEKLDAERMAAAVLEETQPDPEAADRGAPELGERFLFGYDMFWYEMASIGDIRRTSQIVYPLNGRMPAAREGVVQQSGGLGDDIPGTRPVRFGVGGISKDGPEDRGLSERCITGFNSGPPLSPSRYNNNIQIIQNKDYVVIIAEMVHDARVIPLDDRPALDDDIRLWTGDSRGYWDGDTLVVETRNFNDLTTSFGSYGTSWDKVLTERFTRTGYAGMDYEYTLDDPATFSDEFTAIIPMGKVAGQLYEYACHEGNHGLTNMLRAERHLERQTGQ